MEHFVTLFDALFLPQGLALYTSLKRTQYSFTLWVVCADDECFTILKNINHPDIKLLKLSDLETPELLRVKSERTKVEYYWTLSSFTFRFVFSEDINVRRVTYIDADLWFLKGTRPIFSLFEQSQKQVLITDHAFTPEYDTSFLHGQYCVQFVTFTREGEAVRQRWENLCLQWCFAREEDGKFGDQKYLENLVAEFPDQVYVLEKKEWAQAPWNSNRFPYSEAIFYHFHSLRITSPNSYQISKYFVLPKNLISHVYQRYWQDLQSSIALLEKHNCPFRPQAKPYPRFMKLLWRLAMPYTVRHWTV